jgi:trimeric autotransporter adhesin
MLIKSKTKSPSILKFYPALTALTVAAVFLTFSTAPARAAESASIFDSFAKFLGFQAAKPQISTEFTPGVCDTAGNIEVESSGGTTAPTAYATLKAAFDAINAGAHTGAINVEVCGNTTETASAALNASGTGDASYTAVTVSPAGGAARTISGEIAGLPILDLNGADNVTIDGLNTNGNALTIQNLSTATTSGTSTVRFIGDATGNTLTNSTILGSATISVSLGTNGGTIFFSTAASGGNGNDNNTISNCNIGAAGSNLPTRAIWGNGTSTNATTANANITITNNRIFDFFSGSAISRGLEISGGNTDWTITGNRFYQTAPRVQTASANHEMMRINNTAGNNFQITGNTFGFASANGTGVYNLTSVSGSTFRAIRLENVGTTTATTVSNNTISGISISGAAGGTGSATGLFIGIHANSAGLVNITNNTIGSTDGSNTVSVTTNSTSASEVYGIYNFTTSATTISGNNLGSISVGNTTSGAMTFYGIRANTSSSVAANYLNNTVGFAAAPIVNTTISTATSQVFGIQNASAIGNITGNTVRNLSSASAGTGTGTTASIIGISQIASAVGQVIAGNNVNTLSNTHPTAAVSVIGINHSGGSTGTTNRVDGNFIHSFSLATTGAGVLRGINVTAGTTSYQNNMVRLGVDAAGNPVNGAYDIIGINDGSGTNNYYHNSVYIGGSSGTSNLLNYAFNSSVTVNTRNFINNIFVNDRAITGGTGGNFAAFFAGTVPNPSGLTTNYNIYYSQNSSTTIRNGGTGYTLAGWRTASGSQDINSLQPTSLSQINFVNAGGNATNVDLHLQSPTLAESAGILVASVATDFDGQTRANLTPVDIGADAGNFTALDLSPPVIVYAPLQATSQTTNRILNAVISDASGVAGAGFAPRIYFNKNAGAYSSTACVLSSGTPTNGNYACTVDYALLGGAVVGDAIQYFVIAQDNVGNVGANPGAGLAASNVNTVTTPPTSPNSFNIVNSFPSTVNVGAGETYTSLTNTGGLFAALNAGVLNSNVTVNLTSDLTGETGTVALNELAQDGAGGFTVTIKPSGAARSITGASAANVGLIRLNGADRITIDGSLNGGTDRSLSITNTGTNVSAVIQFNNSGASNAGATDNTIKNTVLATTIDYSASTTVTFGISNGGAAVGTVGVDNDNNSFINNQISRVSVGIYSAGETDANPNQNTAINNNLIGPAAFGPDQIGRVGIVLVRSNNASINDNEVRFVGVLEPQTSSGGSVDKMGIAFAVDGWSETASGGVGVTNTTVLRNRIHDIVEENTFSAVGIGVFAGSGTNPTNNIIANNFIWNVRANGTSGDNSVGIGVASGNGDTIVYNSIFNTGDLDPGTSTTATTPSFGIQVSSTAPTNLTLKNNISFVDLTSNTATFKHGAIRIPASYNWGTGGSDFNDLYFPTANAQGIVGRVGATEAATLADYRTASNQETSSISADPLYVSATDLHIQPTSPAFNVGTPIAAVTTDIDGNLRTTQPDIGADEIVLAQPGTLALSASTYSVNETAASVTITVNRTGGSDGAVTVDFGLTNGTATGGAACGAGVDFVNTGGTVNFANGETTKNFTVGICDDALFEGSETFNVTLANATGGATIGSPSTAVVTITEIKAQPSLQFNSGTTSVAENGGTVSLTVTRTGAADNAVSVDYATSNGTATGGASCGTGVDYVTSNGTLNFATGENSKSFTVTICNDTVFEGSENFSATLTNASGGAVIGSPATQTVTITDDKATPALSINSISQSEGNRGTTAFTFTVNLSTATTQPVTVNYATTDGTATTLRDYQAANGSLSFAAGETSKTLTVNVFGDITTEGNETFTVTLTNPTNATIGTGSATGTITNDDTNTRPTLFDFDGDRISDVSVFRPSSGTWLFLNSVTNQPSGIQWGTAGDRVTPADFDGDGKTDVAVWRENPNGATNFFILNSADNTFRRAEFGQPGDIPFVVGDWDNDGKADPTIYRPATGAGSGSFFYLGSLNNPNNNASSIVWGAAGDVPVRGDFDGDGKLDAAVFRPSNGTWYIRQSSNSALTAVQFGLATDKLAPADYDGDGKTDIAIFRDGLWVILQSGNNQPLFANWGTTGDIPLTGDFDADGSTDLAVYRNGDWFVRRSTQGFAATQWGANTDTATSSVYVR